MLKLALLALGDVVKPAQLIGTRARVEHVRSVSSIMAMAERRPLDGVVIQSHTNSRRAIDVARAINACESLSSIAVVGLIFNPNEDAIATGLRLGLDECLDASLASGEMIARIEAACARKAKLAREILRFDDVLLDPLQFKVWRNGKVLTLSYTQFKVLHFLMRHPRTVFSRMELMLAVWGSDDLQEGAVTACVTRIRRELNRHGDHNLIVSTRGGGYSLQLSDVPNLGDAKSPQATSNCNEQPTHM